jgi:hypothetical protein
MKCREEGERGILSPRQARRMKRELKNLRMRRGRERRGMKAILRRRMTTVMRRILRS